MDKAIFFDRDGTLNFDGGYTYKTGDYQLLLGVIEALKLLSKEFKFFIITNQSGISRGFFNLNDVHRFNDRMIDEFLKKSIQIEKIYICPHHPDEGCNCRKPNIKFINEAKKEFDLDLKNSWVIGDHPHDIELGINAGCKSIYLLTGHGERHKNDIKNDPDFIANNLMEAAEFILKIK